jgi:nucleotide-binding universal stress UspA family protein
MKLFVPYDGSDLAGSALERAGVVAGFLDADVIAATVIPRGNTNYARSHGWIDPGDSFDLEAIVSRLESEVSDIFPAATFRHMTVDRYAPTGTIANRLRRMAREAGVAMVFLGSRNVGQVVSSLGSVGTSVARDDAYDLVIVRSTDPPALDAE